MRIYLSGIGGVGIGPLAQIAHDGGFDVAGSDANESLMTEQLKKSGLTVYIGQDGSQIARHHATQPIDWFVYTSALPHNHPELQFARSQGIRISKRDEFLANFIKQKNLKLIAIAGTHGKTTTTGLFVYAMKQLGIPLSYSIGTTLSWAASGAYDSASDYFVYECDEYDRNFLHFEPYSSIITALDYDHVDTYTTIEDYKKAFVQFIQQSDFSILWEKDLRYLHTELDANYESYDELMDLSHITLPGDHVRHNAFLVQKILEKIFAEMEEAGRMKEKIITAINAFPGTGRRFEKLADNLYSDYGHHPVEITATLQMAHEISDHVVLVYQPHQNVRQHEVRDEYTDEVFSYADEIYWLPTYLSREDPSLETLTPQQLSAHLSNKKSVHFDDMNDTLWVDIQHHRDAGHLVLIMGAGSIDGWVRQQLNK
ncbi:MAG: Mur ligase domain-containing protein [Candidatus Saccharimonadales bacterium]